MVKRQSFMMETKTFDIKKSKNELPNPPSKHKLVHVNLFHSCLFIFHFIFGKDNEILKSQ